MADKILIKFNGASKAVYVDRDEAMYFVERGEAKIVRHYRTATSPPPRRRRERRRDALETDN